MLILSTRCRKIITLPINTDAADGYRVIQCGGGVTLDNRAAPQTLHITAAGFCGAVDAYAGSEP